MEVAVDGTWVGYGVGVPDGVTPVATGVPVGVAPVVTGVDAGVGASTVAVGACEGVPGGCRGGGPISSPHSAPALGLGSANSPSCAAVIAAAICPGPPSASIRHCIPARSSGLIPNMGAVASHSWSVRQATVTESAAMLPAMALPGSPSKPAVMTALGSMTANACPDAVGSFLAERPWTRHEPGEKNPVDGLVLEAPEEPGLSLGVLADTRQFGIR